MNTPVAIIIFNRPDKLRQLLKILSVVKPRELFVVADGPRDSVPEDKKKCQKTRELIENLEWDCKIFKNYSEVNLGCGIRPATGISWVFEYVDKAIFLEDDCIPHPSFFRFCEELLEKYKENEKIYQICGNNLQMGRERTPYSYYFTRHNICWGWATWKRAWRNYDMKIKKWPLLKNTSWLLDILENKVAVQYWDKIFDKAYHPGRKIDFWDYQWRFTLWEHDGLAILPNKTLVHNIGFDESATHTFWSNHEYANMQYTEISFPLLHPPEVKINREAELFLIDSFLKHQRPQPVKQSRDGLLMRARRFIRKLK